MERSFTRNTLKSSLALALVAAAAACADAPTAPASVRGAGAPSLATSANATSNEVDFPIQRGIIVPCGRLGQEIVVLSGSEHFSFQQSTSAAGTMHVRFHTNAQGVTGLGLVSGDTYRASGSTQESYTWDVGQYPFSYDLVYSFNMTSPGATGNIVAHEVLRVNYDAYGNPDLQLAKFDAECR